MEQLPPEILVEIFNRLDIDQVKICRLVNKQFRSVINSHLRLKDLVISGKTILSTNKWLFTDELISHQNWFKDAHYPGFSSRSDLFRNIKQLYIEDQLVSSKFLLNIIRNIDKFKQLESIEIIALNILGGLNSLKIDLPKLIVFNLGDAKFKSVQLNTPKLIYLRSKLLNLSSIEVVHPESVKYLEIGNFDSTLKNFVNLENLYCFNFKKFEPNLEQILAATKLKQIHFMRDREALPQLRKLESKKMGFKIYFYGLEISRINPSPKLFFDTNLSGQEFSYLIENCDLLADQLPFFKKMNYIRLEKKDANPLAFVRQEVLSKFNRLTSLSVQSAVNNRSLLTSLLGHCPNLQELDVSDSAGLSAKIFNSLPNLLPNLESLTFYGKKKSIKLKMDTIFKFKRILLLDVNKRFKLDELRAFCERAFKETKLREFGFFYNHAFCKIICEAGLYSVRIDYMDDDEKCDNLDDLFGWIEEGCREMFELCQYKRRQYLGPSSDESDYDPKRKGKSKYDPDTEEDSDNDFKNFFMSILKTKKRRIK